MRRTRRWRRRIAASSPRWPESSGPLPRCSAGSRHPAPDDIDAELRRLPPPGSLFRMSVVGPRMVRTQRAAGADQRRRAVHTTNYFDTFIEVADDCPVGAAEVPPDKTSGKTVAQLHYELIAAHPYEF